MYTLTVLEKRPADVLKTSWKDAHGVTSLGCPQDVNFERHVQMHFQILQMLLYMILGNRPKDVLKTS